jgi:hypothetical protein
MTQDHDRGSAVVYQFPAGGRAGVRARRADATPVPSQTQARFAKIACGAAWYHEEAIKQAEPPRN